MKKKIALIGLQTGDEGKGVRVAHYAGEAVRKSRHKSGGDPTVWNMRWQGGANAGHTAVMGSETYKLHQIPSGILIDGVDNIMGEGVFFNPRKCMEEIRGLVEQGIGVSPRNLGIASNAHVTLDYHVDEDKRDREKKNHTSTGSGIKQTAEDKYGRRGLRFQEFLDPETFGEFLKERRFPEFFPTKFGSIDEFVDSYRAEIEFLRQFSVLQSRVLNDPGFEYGIGEGAQGFRLDVDRGLYPGITSSNPSIVPFRPNLILGVMKLYESSVGSDRPLVGQMGEELESRAREEWGERGTTTGLDRDLGYVDIVAIRNAIESSGVDYLVGSCGDRLELMSELDEKVKLVVAYDVDSVRYDRWDESFHNRKTLYRATPVFEEFDPWDEFTDHNGELTGNAQRYVDRIQGLTGREFILLGTGPGVEDYIEYKDAFDLEGVAV